MTARLAVTVVEAADMMGVGKTTVWKLLAERKLESFMVETNRRIKVSEIERYMDANTIPRKKN